MTNEETGRTEAVYREVNEAIAQTAERIDAAEVALVCECGDAECIERVTAEVEVYERVRAHPTRFILVEGHEEPTVERVLETRDGYAIVDKTERDAARVARRLNPRDGK